MRWQSNGGHLIIEDNPGGHEQLSKAVNIDTPSLVLTKVYARLLEQLDAVLSVHVVSHFELPVTNSQSRKAIETSFIWPGEAERPSHFPKQFVARF